MAVMPTRHALGRIQTQQFAPRDPIQHTPHFVTGVGTDISRRRLSPGTAFQIEAQSVAPYPRDAPFARLHAAPFAKRAVVHVGAIGEIPNQIGWTPGESLTVPTVMKARQSPR